MDVGKASKRRMVEELIVHAVLFVAMVVLFQESRTFPTLNIGGQLGAAWWPQLLLTLGMVLTAASAVSVVHKNLGAPWGKGKVSLVELKSLGVSTGIFVAFLLVIDVVGFLGTVPLLVFGFMYQLGARKLPVLIIASILAGPLFAVIFGRLMELPLPRGMGLIRLFSFYFY
jgi:putative tricarboxylic transport membrane protein